MQKVVKACLLPVIFGLVVIFVSLNNIIVHRLNSCGTASYSYTSTSKLDNHTSAAVDNQHQASMPLEIETSQPCASILNFIYSGVLDSINESETTGHTSRDNDENQRTISTNNTPHGSFEIDDANTTSSTNAALVYTWLPSIENLWQHSIHPRLLPHVKHFANSVWSDRERNVINRTQMEIDYQMVHNEFIVPYLRKSIIHPMDTKQMHTLLRIIALRLSDPSKHPPLEIVAFGPSVVEGRYSENHNWWLSGFERKRPGSRQIFAWPARLEDVLNNVVFRGRNVVRVTNLGSGGTSSTSGTLAMEYRLFAETAPLPDIVINSFGITDARRASDDEGTLRIVQEFILAAKKLRCNDAHGLPYVILFDDFLGLIVEQEDDLYFSTKMHRTLSQAAEWYNVMAASYASAFRHTVLSDEGFGGTNPSSNLPMLGWRLDVHPAMLYHSTTPWVLVFNLIDNMVNACHDYATVLAHEPSYPKLDINHIPTVTSDKLLRDLPRLWKENIAAYHERCKIAPEDGTSPCSRVSWLVNGSSGKKRTPHELNAFLEAMSMESLQDWTVEGRRNGLGKPRVGWVATAANATFTISIKDTDHDGMKAMSIVSLRSYGEKWEGSRLRVTVWDEGSLGQGPPSQIGEYDIGGFHGLNMSVYYENKFALGENGIPKGNWLKARFDLIGGSTFKIQGILFCIW